ncbi:Nucleoside-diphosphate-sugar epimerase [Amycolatopsis arida]|uniref:Nucleoside-diphosphate-sugar epimerase n=1 Tax=Amycolatopsis arida TaxID=587909 RepID=A0A1I5V5B3_9PSEU|nr:NAD(P)-dependent oxidoreductase [Amycolatopsis arida]TDX91157.1 nucleoside-diphosphate-sugar epimerase [Amycolatopsis arida]SFQ02743.1 Nucleoside-diphosphate-sugar epimerase [Amycolatopsis arida]
MKVFVTGATGVLGRRAVPELVRAGHEVTAVARSADKAALLRGWDAEPVGVDLFDPAAVCAAVAGHDVVVNLATRIPPPSRAAFSRAWAEGSRLRSEASRNLVDAALAAGADRFVQESIAFIYPDSGDRWIDEDVPLDPPALGRANQAAEAQAARFTAAGGTGVVLRFGQFYAPEAVHTRYMLSMLRRRMPALPGPRDAYSPTVAAEDAGTAVAAALDVPAGTWNVCDDEPLTRAAFHRAVAEALGVRPPLGTGSLLFRLSGNTRFYLRSLRVANRRFTAASGWSPRYPDAASGWRALLADIPAKK